MTFSAVVTKLKIDDNVIITNNVSNQPRIGNSLSATNSSKSSTNDGSTYSRPSTPDYSDCNHKIMNYNSNVNKISIQNKRKKGCYNFFQMIMDLCDKRSAFRGVIKPVSIKYTIYLCLATILVCARSTIWAFYTGLFSMHISIFLMFFYF